MKERLFLMKSVHMKQLVKIQIRLFYFHILQVAPLNHWQQSHNKQCPKFKTKTKKTTTNFSYFKRCHNIQHESQ